ncbi:hypothetical protein LA080_014740 [Diaporthe eres]|nr:hypothetical protein LA080_014740 [Diaporthe eres]
MLRSSLSEDEIETRVGNGLSFGAPPGLTQGKHPGRHTRVNSPPRSYMFLTYDIADAEYMVYGARTSLDKRGRSVAPDYDPKMEVLPLVGIHNEEEAGYRSAGYDVDRQSSGSSTKPALRARTQLGGNEVGSKDEASSDCMIISGNVQRLLTCGDSIRPRIGMIHLWATGSPVSLERADLGHKWKRSRGRSAGHACGKVDYCHHTELADAPAALRALRPPALYRGQEICHEELVSEAFGPLASICFICWAPVFGTRCGVQTREAKEVRFPRGFSGFFFLSPVQLLSGGLTSLSLVSLVSEEPGSLTAEAHPSNGTSMTQLPSGSEGTAYGVLAWAFTCLFCNLLIIWLLVQSKEKGSYLFFISSAALIANSTSIAQLIMLIINYQDVMWDRLRYLKYLAKTGIPALVALNSYDTGADKILSSMRWACFTIEAGLAFCWSFQLMHSVYGLAESPSMRRPLTLINRIGKPVAIILPIIQAGLLQLTPLKKSAFWYFFTADILLRVTIPMVFISAFEGYNIVVQVTYNHMDISDSLTAEPDLTASKAQSTMAAFIPGCVAGLFLLLCFGTTRQFRRRLYKTFVPVRFQRASSGQSMTSSRASYAAMDDDPGVLSRQRRLSMERKMQIQVTTEVEIKMEVLDKPAPMEYSVLEHHWDDVSPILPGRTRGHGGRMLH